MKKSTLVSVLKEVQRQYDDNEISEEQYIVFMSKARSIMDHTLLEDPVWEKPARAITKPRPHKNGAWKKYQ